MQDPHLDTIRASFSNIKPVAQCPWHACILQDPIEHVFSQDSLEDHTVRYKCLPENFRGHFLRRPFQALANLTLCDEQLKSADLYLNVHSKRILLESCQALAGTVQFHSFTSPSVFFLETSTNVYLELECTLGTDDIDQVPDFVGRAMGYRFGMPDMEGPLGLVECPEATLKIQWIGREVVQVQQDDESASSSSSVVSDLLEEVLYDEHKDSSDLRTVLQQPHVIKRHCSRT